MQGWTKAPQSEPPLFDKHQLGWLQTAPILYTNSWDFKNCMSRLVCINVYLDDEFFLNGWIEARDGHLPIGPSMWECYIGDSWFACALTVGLL
eukprot:SAG31_NODE_3175_length_4586_cov_4.176064_6_plen_93_part_00